MYPPVNPILVQLGPLAIHWYAITMMLAIVLGTFVASRYVARHGQDSSTIWDMLLWVLVPALVGARLYYVFIQSPRGPQGIEHYLSHPIEILQIWNGGIHIYGALIFGGIAVLLYLRVHKLPFSIYLDGVGLGLLLGQAIGRIGNFINQELYGPPTTLPWGLRIDPAHRVPPYNNLSLYPESVRFQPLFLYELLWDALGFVLLLWISRRFGKRLRNGDLFLMYLIWAPLGRFFIEFMRTDSWFFPGTPFDILHVVIAIIVLSASTMLVIRFVRRKPDALAQENTGASSSDTQDTSGQTLEEVAAKTGTTDQTATEADGDNPGVGSLGMES